MAEESRQPLITSKDQDAVRRRSRSWAIMAVLIGLCVLFYAITIVKMAHQ